MCHTWEGDQVPNRGMHIQQMKWHHSFLHFVTISSHCMRQEEKEHICRHKYHGASLELLWWIGVHLILRFLSPKISTVSLSGALAKMMQVKPIWNVSERIHTVISCAGTISVLLKFVVKPFCHRQNYDVTSVQPYDLQGFVLTHRILL